MGEEKQPEKDTDELFQRTLEKLVGTPPKPHAPLNPKKEKNNGSR